MKIIFLDIDGVLVTRRLGTFEESLLQNLKRIVDETGATIVLSSDWRRHPAARLEAKRVLATVGLSFIACTPTLSAYIAQRPTEIMQWKRDYQKRADSERITNWVAIDDRPLLEERHGSYLRGHFVQTQPLRGITDTTIDDCISILNQEAPPQRGATQTNGSSMVSEALSPDGLAALGAGIRVGNGTSGGMRGTSSGLPGPLLGGSPGSKRGNFPPQGLAGLGPGFHTFGLANLGDGPSSPDTPASSAALPALARQRGRSTGAPPMVGNRR